MNYEFEQIAREVIAETKATDEVEDEVHGDQRGDELPAKLCTPEGRREFFPQAPTVAANAGDEGWEQIAEPEREPAEEVSLELDAERIVGRAQGREGWLREGKRRLEQHRWENPDPISRSRGGRLLLAAERREADLAVERRANEAYEGYRARGRMREGRRFGGPPSRICRPGCRPGR